jgi:molybdate transport system regulatory protein
MGRSPFLENEKVRCRCRHLSNANRPDYSPPMPKLIIRVEFSPTSAIGPGKIRLLEHIEETGSISAAGRAMKMSYRRAWLLVADLNRLFKEPVTTAGHGGRGGGGAKLTAFGRDLVRKYREIEAHALSVSAKPLARLEAAMRRPARLKAGK